MRTAFVFSGGGARGAAQAGMVTTLLQAGIKPDLIVGASAGAINAVMLAHDPSLARAAEMAQLWREMRASDLYDPSRVKVVANLIRRQPNVYTPNRFSTMIAKWATVDRVEDLPVPTRIATTHMGDGRTTYHDSGSVEQVLLASTAIPGVFPPVRLPDRDGGESLHIDGGICGVVPLSGLLDTHVDRAIVMDVSRFTAVGASTLRNPVSALVAALNVATRNHVTPELPGVEIIHLRLDPHYDNGGILNFTHSEELLRLGREVAEAALPAATLRSEPARRVGLMKRIGLGRSAVQA